MSADKGGLSSVVSKVVGLHNISRALLNVSTKPNIPRLVLETEDGTETTPLEAEASENVAVVRKAASPKFCSMEHSPYFVMKVAARGNVKVLETMLDEDPDRLTLKDPKGWTCLHHATFKQQIAAIDYLLQRGADINSADKVGNTALYLACDVGKTEAVKHLLLNGADGNLYNNRGMAAIHVATSANQAEIIKILSTFEDKVDINGKTEDSGATAFHLAAAKDYVEANQALIDLKCKYTTCHNGSYPINIAAKRASLRVLELMLKTSDQMDLPLEEMMSLVDQENNTPLHSAVSSGNYEAVLICLKYGALVDAKQEDGATPFHHACSQGNVEVVKIMLEKHIELKGKVLGLNILDVKDSCEMTPLHNAAFFDHAAVVNYLIGMGADIDALECENRTPLQLAAQRGGAETMNVLIENGANIAHRDRCDQSVLHFLVTSSAAGSMTDEVERICSTKEGKALLNLKDANGFTPLHIASKQGNLKFTETLIKLGAEINTKDNDDQSPLHFAAMFGQFNTVRRLLDSVVGRNMINEADGNGFTPLHIASQNGHTKVVQHLLFKGAIIHKDDFGRTPLHLAAESGYNQTVRLLLSVHPNLLSMKDKKEYTALHYAAEACRSHVVETLLTLGSDYDYDIDGKTPMDLAIEHRHVEVGLIMVQHERWDEILTKPPIHSTNPTLGCIQFMPEVYKAILDRCIDRAPVDHRAPDYYVKFDFRYMQVEDKPQTMLMVADSGPGGQETLPLIALNKMVEFGRLNLLSHPLCLQYLKFKWRSYGAWFYFINLIVYLTFVSTLTGLAIRFDPLDHVSEELLEDSVDQEPHSFTNKTLLELTEIIEEKKAGNVLNNEVHVEFALRVLMTVVSVFLLGNILKEMTQIAQQRAQYFTDVVNYIECLLYVCGLFFVTPAIISGEFSHFQWQCGIVAIFLAWFNLLLFLQRMNVIGLYIVMFLQILNTMLKVIVAFAVLFLAFGLTFFILLHYNVVAVRSRHANNRGDDSAEVNGFYSPIISMISSVMLMMGDWDFSGVYVRPLLDDSPLTLHFPFLSFIFLIVFVVLMPILFINLMTGLAVGDIEMVQKDAKLKRLAMQVEYHTDLEKKLPQWLMAKVDKKILTIYPNRMYRQPWIRKLMQVLKVVRSVTVGEDPLKLLPEEMFTAAVVLEELDKQKKRIKDVHTNMEKQFKMLKLIVNKLEIRSEVDDYDEGVAPKAQLATAANTTNKLAGGSLTAGRTSRNSSKHGQKGCKAVWAMKTASRLGLGRGYR